MTRRSRSTRPKEIAAGVYWLAVRGCNVYLVRSGSAWVLIDAAWRNSAPHIRVAAESLFGPGTPPVGPTTRSSSN